MARTGIAGSATTAITEITVVLCASGKLRQRLNHHIAVDNKTRVRKLLTQAINSVIF